MFDIGFYMKARKLKGITFDTLESIRNRIPVVYNIETTNACNMRCRMCPRTTMMTRPVETMAKDTFLRIINQIKPHLDKSWAAWERFVEREYGIPRNDVSENHFFLYVIPRVLQLHGYGDPLLDNNMVGYVEALSDKGILSYFSCNPANINAGKMTDMFKAGLSYVKFSIESVDDVTHREIRGKASDFTESYQNILNLLEVKARGGYRTFIVITMLNLNRANQTEDFQRLKEAFNGTDVYPYIKSEDQQWYRRDFHGTASIHWSEPCRHPWMSMTIKSDGKAAMCMEDFNNEIILGDAAKEPLADIWNGAAYKKLRQDHLARTPGIKCSERCDMKLMGDVGREA